LYIILYFCQQTAGFQCPVKYSMTGALQHRRHLSPCVTKEMQVSLGAQGLYVPLRGLT